MLVCLQMTQRDAVDHLERGGADTGGRGSLPTIVFAARRRSASGMLMSRISVLGDTTLSHGDARGKDVALVA